MTCRKTLSSLNIGKMLRLFFKKDQKFACALDGPKVLAKSQSWNVTFKQMGFNSCTRHFFFFFTMRNAFCISFWYIVSLNILKSRITYWLKCKSQNFSQNMWEMKCLLWPLRRQHHNERWNFKRKIHALHLPPPAGGAGSERSAPYAPALWQLAAYGRGHQAGGAFSPLYQLYG